MPVLRNVSLTMDMDQVLRRQEIGFRSKLRPELMAILHELLAEVDDLELLQPAIAYEFGLVNELWPERLSLSKNDSTDSAFSTSVLSTAKKLAVMVCTIGPRLEEKVTFYSDSREPLRALMLDGIGSAAVDSLAQAACHLISLEASSGGYQASSPLSPGMPGMPISDQRQLFQMVPAAQIGVSLTSRQVMVPRKSVSMVIGIGPQMPTWSQVEVCACCSMKRACLHRNTGKTRI